MDTLWIPLISWTHCIDFHKFSGQALNSTNFVDTVFSWNSRMFPRQQQSFFKDFWAELAVKNSEPKLFKQIYSMIKDFPNYRLASRSWTEFFQSCFLKIERSKFRMMRQNLCQYCITKWTTFFLLEIRAILTHFLKNLLENGTFSSLFSLHNFWTRSELQNP